MENPSRSAVVTGGTGALGAAVTQALLKEGCKVAIPVTSNRHISDFEQKIGRLKSRVMTVSADLTVESEVENFFQTVIDDLGHIDILANIAGGFFGGVPVADTDLEKWDFMMDLNLKATFLCCKAVIPQMIERRYGKIVNVSARAGLSGIAGLGAYCASKSGLRVLTESIAEEVKDSGINVNSILPSIIDTPANRKAMPDEDHSRWVSPSDIAKVILFLTSDDSAIINGAAIPVYGRA
ncbi:MAG: SDR family NAD(P)-dependent oxidoreductase [Candidatus Poribacteria bacterium]|nr:SDR family NAD(P)-dependent oxidoreductase [Candidatus Poribacteria bacterium]